MVPVRSNLDSPDFQISTIQPTIRNTAIELPSEAFGLSNYKWFFWGINSPESILNNAELKLSAKTFDIFNILSLKETVNYINKWIEKDDSKIKLLLKELRVKDEMAVKRELFKENFKKLRLFQFPDGTFISDEELVEKQNEGYIILHKNLSSIKPELEKIGIQVSSVDLDDLNFYSTYNFYFSNDSQLRNYSKIIEIVSNADIEKLSCEEKWKIFRLLRDGTEEGKRNERLGELKLFRNNLGDYVHLKNILGTTDQSWLFPFQIKSEESHPDVNRYLISNKNFFYERIIFPFWPVLSKQIVEKDFEKQTQIFKEISRCYNLTEVSKEEELQLYKKKVVFYQGESNEVENLFYHPDLKMITKENYKSVQKSVLEYLDVVIPDYEYLELYSEAPFRLESTSDGFPVEY